MVRFLGHLGPKVCEILHLPQLKQSNTCFFGKKKNKKKKPEGETRVVCISELLNRDIDEFILLWEFRARSGSVSRRCSGGVDDSVIGCKARKARARSVGLSCIPHHPRSLPYRDFDASCKTGRFVLERD